MYGFCKKCHRMVHWVQSPSGGWWAHDEHPEDGHDASMDRDPRDEELEI
jgi:hypothetical protein